MIRARTEMAWRKKATDTLETKGVPALRKRKCARGVCFDRRSQKFVASITIKGRRIYLGSFSELDDAAAAHALARHDNPIKRGAKGSGVGDAFVDAYDAFLEDYADRYGLPKGTLQEGAEFRSPDNQVYTLVAVEVVHKPDSKAKWNYNRWYSHCSECGEDFITSTMVGTKRISGMTRTCPMHRKGGPRGDEPKEHIAALKLARAKLAAEKIEEAKEAEIKALVEIEYAKPNSTRESGRAAYEAARALVEAKYANRLEDLV
jgi:hypothetical protein